MPDFFDLYQSWQVQLIRNALATMLADGIDPVALVAQADAILLARPVVQHQLKSATVARICPSCGGSKIRTISEDGLSILACYDCRWSGIINTEVRHGA